MGIVIGSLVGISFAPHVLVAWAFDSLLLLTLAYVLAKADAGCKGRGAAFFGGLLGAGIPFVLMVTFSDRYGAFLERREVDMFALPFFVLVFVMPTGLIFGAWLGAGIAGSLRKP